MGADVHPGAIYRLQLGLETAGVWDADNGGCPGCSNIKVSRCDNTLVAKVHWMTFTAIFFQEKNKGSVVALLLSGLLSPAEMETEGQTCTSLHAGGREE